jgi:hypothetical protein
MYKNKKSRKYLNKRMRIKNKTKTLQKRLRKLKRGGNPEGDRPPPRPAPPPFVLDNALVAQVQAEIARLNAVLVNLVNNNVQGARLFLGVIIMYFRTVLDNYMQSSNNIRGNQMVNLLNQMLAQSQGVIAGINLNAMRLLSQQIGDNVLLANGDDERYN